MSCSAPTTIVKLNSQSPDQLRLSRPSNQSPICRSTDCDCCRDRHPNARRSCCTASFCRCHRSRSSGDEGKMKKFNLKSPDLNVTKSMRSIIATQSKSAENKLKMNAFDERKMQFDNWSYLWEDVEKCISSVTRIFTIYENVSQWPKP